jgi:hypothetical protein
MPPSRALAILFFALGLFLLVEDLRRRLRHPAPSRERHRLDAQILLTIGVLISFTPRVAATESERYSIATTALSMALLLLALHRMYLTRGRRSDLIQAGRDRF